MALLARRGRFDPAAVSQELARAAAEASAGRQDRARKRYAKLAKSLSAGPEQARGAWGAALAGQAASTAAAGEGAEALALYAQAFPLVADPARELPREALQELAAGRMAAAEGSIAAPLAFLRATAAGADSPAQAQAVAQTTGWVQRVCAQGPVAAREDACAQAVAALPGRDWPLLASAAALVDAGRPGEAERLLAGAAAGAGGEVWFRWAALLFADGRFEQAVTGFDEALRRGAGAEAGPWARGALLGAECLLFRGMARDRLGQDGAARADLVAAVAHAPADPRPRDAVARLALKLGADHVAREQFGTILTHTPDYLPARLGLGLVEERAGNFPAAVEQYQAAVTAAPDSRPARVRWGAALTAAGRHAEAVRVLRPLADGAGGAAAVEAAFRLGAALFASGDAAGALECWESVPGEELAAHRAAARDRVARGLLADEPGRARRAWQQAVAEHPLPAYLAGLREAALREAAFALLAGRDTREGREAAGHALGCARQPSPAVAAADAVTVRPEDARPAEGMSWAGRADRLASMLSLAQDDASGVSGQPGMRAGIRERCHAAAGLLLTDRAKQGALLLAEVPQDPAGDAMLARLRALVAERAGNWRGALEWHLRFLTVPAPADAAADGPAPRHSGAAGPAGAVCTASGESCEEPATQSCGACGREGCARHAWRVEGSGSPRCATCAATALSAVLACAARADALEEAVPVLAAWEAQLGTLPAAADVRRGLALARARLGELDEALALLGEAETAGAPDIARELSAVLVRRAALDLRADRATRAAADLRRAVDLTPDHAPALAALAPLAEHEAWGHACEGRWRQAFDAYLPLLRADPAHPRLLHAVGVTGYRLAAATAEAETPAAGEAGGAETDRVWAWTLAALTAALYLPDLWAATAQASGRELEPGQVAKARAALVDRLRTDLRALDRAAGRDGEEIDAWTVRLGMEVRCAEAFAQEELRLALGDGPARRLVLGPGLRRLLTDPEQASTTLAEWQERYAAAVRPYALAAARPHETGNPAAGSALTEVFGLLHRTLGPHRYLMLRGRFAPAIAALESLPSAQRDGAHQALLAEALTGLGEEQYRARVWPESLQAFSRAAKLARAGLSDKHAKMAVDAGMYAARALLGENETRDDQAGAVALLECAAELAPGDRALQAELGAAYAQLARKTSNEDRDYERALELLRKAGTLAPEDRLARDFLRVVLGNLASKLTDEPAATPEQLRRAADMWREATVLDPDPKVKSNLGYTLSLLARHAALTGDRLGALELMTEAVRNDPENRGEIAFEATRRMSVMLANYALDDLKSRPFTERAEVLRRARSFDDSPEVRRVMCGAWRAQAVARFEDKRMDEAELLLQEAAKLAVNETTRGEIIEDLVAVYRAHAVRAANARRIAEAKTAIGKAVALAPGNREAAALKRSIDAMR